MERTEYGRVTGVLSSTTGLARLLGRDTEYRLALAVELPAPRDGRLGDLHQARAGQGCRAGFTALAAGIGEGRDLSPQAAEGDLRALATTEAR